MEEEAGTLPPFVWADYRDAGMQLVLMLAVLAALALGEGGAPGPVPGLSGRLALAGGGVLLVAGSAFALAQVFARQLQWEGGAAHLLVRQFRIARRVHGAVWLAVAGAILYGLDWGRLVRFNLGLEHTLLLDDLLVLAPVLLPLFLSWLAFYEVDRTVWTSGGAAALSRTAYMTFQVRHYLGLLLVPVLGLLMLDDVARLVLPDWGNDAHVAAVMAPGLLALFLGFPFILRGVWRTTPLPAGAFRSRLEDVARQLDFHARDLLVWHTHGMMANAAVAGMVPRLRYVFFTDALLTSLSAEEVEAVFAHEIGHVRHRHLLWRVLAMVAPIALGLALADAAGVSADAWQEAMVSAGFDVPAALLLIAGVGGYAWLVFGWYSRLLEHQADLCACRRDGKTLHEEGVAVYVAALNRLAAVAGVNRRRKGWQHASIERRTAFLERAQCDPAFARRFEWKLRWMGAAIATVVVGSMAAGLRI